MLTSRRKCMRRQTAVTITTLLSGYYLLLRSKAKRRWWVRPINQNRRQQGDYHNLIQEMRLMDVEMFFNYTRMSVELFDDLLRLVGPSLTKTSIRESILPAARLALTLRHLAAGDSIPTIAFAYRMGKSTVCNIINETNEVLWTTLHPIVLKEPDESDWNNISEEFLNRWNIPNCLGALDGKHVVMRSPYKSGSLYYSYKKTFSIILFAVCDAQYRFTYVDIGAYGWQSDGGVLRASRFGDKLNNNGLQVPEESAFPGLSKATPFYFVGDEAFPLQNNLMRPYGGKNLTQEQRIFNYRLSRARRCIENAFGILAARFRIFHTVIFKNPENVDKVVQAAVCLHNFIKQREDNLPSSRRQYAPCGFADTEIRGRIIPGQWRQEVPLNCALDIASKVKRLGARNARQSASTYRDFIKTYFNSELGAVPWQTEILENSW